MTLTLVLYCILCFGAICLTLVEKKNSWLYFCVFIALVVWSVVIRLYSIQIDMITYTNTMSYDWGVYQQFYFLREPVYWFTSRFLYDVTQDTFWVLVILDSVIFLFFTLVAYKTKLQPYFILLFFLFFPSVMGILNVYRQYISTVFLFLMLLLSFDNPFKSKITYLICVLTHNVGAIFLPVVVAKKKFFQPKFILATLISLLAMVIMANTKSEAETGETSPFLFVAVTTLVMAVYLVLNKFIISKKNVDLYYINIYCFFVSLVSSVLLASAPAKRISMIALMLLFYSIYRTIEENKGSKGTLILFRLMFVAFALIPSFIFPSVFNMLSFEGL